jgi:hypothetical protein
MGWVDSSSTKQHRTDEVSARHGAKEIMVSILLQTSMRDQNTRVGRREVLRELSDAHGPLAS